MTIEAEASVDLSKYSAGLPFKDTVVYFPKGDVSTQKANLWRRRVIMRDEWEDAGKDFVAYFDDRTRGQGLRNFDWGLQSVEMSYREISGTLGLSNRADIKHTRKALCIGLQLHDETKPSVPAYQFSMTEFTQLLVGIFAYHRIYHNSSMLEPSPRV